MPIRASASPDGHLVPKGNRDVPETHPQTRYCHVWILGEEKPEALFLFSQTEVPSGPPPTSGASLPLSSRRHWRLHSPLLPSVWPRSFPTYKGTGRVLKKQAPWTNAFWPVFTTTFVPSNRSDEQKFLNQ